MFDVAPTELLLVAVVALIVIGPKDLPKAMRVVGYWVGKARGVARQFRTGLDSMVREAEMAEMEKKWAEENARIMREHPPHPATAADYGDPTEAHHPVTPSPDVSGPVADDDPTPLIVERPVVVPADSGPAVALPGDKAPS